MRILDKEIIFFQLEMFDGVGLGVENTECMGGIKRFECRLVGEGNFGNVFSLFDRKGIQEIVFSQHMDKIVIAVVFDVGLSEIGDV